MKVILTGGHLSPAFSVIELFKKEEVLLVGRKNALEGDNALSLEYKMAKSLSIPFAEITAGRLQRKFTRYTIISLLKFPIGFIQSIKILRDFKPDVVLGFGGYVSLPIIFGAKILGISIVIHEQTLEAGFSNKLASFFADKICISWESSKNFFPIAKTILTGNPIRSEILNIKPRVKDQIKKFPLIYITGGSLGSHAINLLVEHSLKNLLEKFEVIHQTGDSRRFEDFERLSKLRESFSEDLRKRYMLKKFLSAGELSQVLDSSDLVISRAGIGTVTELIYLNKPSILIPLLVSQRNEQVKNSLFAKSVGIAEFLNQYKTSADLFLQKIEFMIQNLDKYRVSSSTNDLIIKDAASRIREVVLDVSKSKKK